MLKNKRRILIILAVFLRILMPTIVKAEEQTISKIDITVPRPIIGKTPAVTSEISVVADGNTQFEVQTVTWYIYDNTIGEYKPVENSSDAFSGYKRYAVEIGYKRPNQYKIPIAEGVVDDEFELKINDIELNAQDYNVFNIGSSGGIDYENDAVFYEFGFPDPEKNISTIDITVPKPEIGKKQYGLEDIIVKADQNEILEALAVEWYKYNPETEEYEFDTIIVSDRIKGFYDEDIEQFKIKEFKEGEKYVVYIMYNRPNEYGYSDEALVKVNGETIDINNIEEFNPGTSGDSEGEWDWVRYEFEELKETIPPTEETDKEKEDNKEEPKKEGVKKDETAAPGSIPHAGGTFVIVLSAIALITVGAYVFYKNRDLRGI